MPSVCYPHHSPLLLLTGFMTATVSQQCNDSVKETLQPYCREVHISVQPLGVSVAHWTDAPSRKGSYSIISDIFDKI